MRMLMRMMVHTDKIERQTFPIIVQSVGPHRGVEISPNIYEELGGLGDKGHLRRGKKKEKKKKTTTKKKTT